MTDLSGQTLGKYQLIERLGRGGMANVYKAFQPGMERYVAIKVMHPHLSEDADFITRFQREAREVAKLRHPNIVQIFDFDVQDENYYMVMEYVEGGMSLKEYLEKLADRGETLPVAATLGIVARLADALDYAHHQGMIHRDIKPANVLLPQIEQPLLSDFGIARLMGETGLTASGAMIGTPAYMSPEQGRGERADERSDIYALGIVLYEMLTGTPPYNADTPYGVILKHINDPLIPPHSIIGNIPEAVERLVFKSLAKDPDQRYQTAGEMRKALQGALADIQEDATFPGVSTESLPVVDNAETVNISAASEPVTSPVATETTAPQKPRKKFGLVFALIVALLVLGGATVGILALSGVFNEDETETAEVEQEEPDEVEIPEGEDAEPGVIFSDLEPLSQRGWEQLTDGDNEAARESFEQALAEDPEDVGALVGRAMLYLNDYDFGAAEANLQHAQALDDDDLLVHFGMGRLQREGELYNPEAAEEQYSIVIERCEENIIICQAAYEDRADIRGWEYLDYGSGIADMDRAIDINIIDWKLPWLYSERGDLRLYGGDPDGAIADYEKAYEFDPREGELLEKAARASVHIRDYERALGIYGRLLENFPGDPRFETGNGYVEYRLGNLDTAMTNGEKALEFQPGFMAAHYLLGLVYIGQGNGEAALEHFRQVEESGLANWEWGSPYFEHRTEFGHEIHYDMARAAYISGQTDAALEFIERSLEEENWWPQPYILRGKIFQDMGQLDAARGEYLQAQEILPDYAGLYPELEGELHELLDSLSP